MTSSTSSSVPPTPSPIQARVCFRQPWLSRDHNARHHAEPTQLSAGYQVRIKVPNRAHKLAPVYSDLVRVIKVVGDTVWLKNGQRWNVRCCLSCHSSLRRESPSPTSLTSSTTPSPLAGTDEDEPGAVFVFRLPTLLRPTAVAARSATTEGATGPRRSQRIHRPRDVGPVVSH